ncbi:MAG: hypothetical protein GXP26_07745 [Planctomycetes bacterium]|nr:hypothetical protein [Planctomycetota bacterium]
MRLRRQYPVKSALRSARRQAVQSHVSWSQRARRLQFGARNQCEPFTPPEDWHEPTGDEKDYRVIVQSPGEGYQHVVTPEQIRQRLESVPQHFLEELEIVQLSRITRKKKSFPCYGMQWGATLYIYPLEESLEEIYYSPPRPEVINESKMYGGQWDRPEQGVWRLSWTPETIADFYLNNILIHELGHLVDDRNTNYTDRERYAEWFAIEHGYLPTGGSTARRSRQVSRRHHKK